MNKNSALSLMILTACCCALWPRLAHAQESPQTALDPKSTKSDRQTRRQQQLDELMTEQKKTADAIENYSDSHTKTDPRQSIGTPSPATTAKQAQIDDLLRQHNASVAALELMAKEDKLPLTEKRKRLQIRVQAALIPWLKNLPECIDQLQLRLEYLRRIEQSPSILKEQYIEALLGIKTKDSDYRMAMDPLPPCLPPLSRQTSTK